MFIIISGHFWLILPDEFHNLEEHDISPNGMLDVTIYVKGIEMKKYENKPSSLVFA